MTKRIWQVLCALAWLMLLMLAPAAHAQTYQNSTDSATGGINDSATPCTSRFTRTFNVVQTGTKVTDVDIGVLMAHTYRADLLMYLVGPDGTRVQLTTGFGGGANDYNLRFNDGAPSNISNYTGSTVVTAATSAPAYAATYRPSVALSAFNGKAASGTWTLEICDRYQQDSGTFYQTDLFLTTVPANDADLSLNKTRIGAVPADGQSVTWRLSVTSASSSLSTATGVTVTDSFPAGFTFVSSTDDPNFDEATGVWNVGSVLPGQTKTIDITGTITATAGVTITNTAEVTTSDQVDLDSTVDNGVTSEDDYAANSFTVAGTRAPGVIPALSCPAGSSLFDWDQVSWTANTTNTSIALAGIGSIGFAITTNGTWVNDADFGGLSPALSDVNLGGFPGSQDSLHQYVDFDNRSQTATTTITLPTTLTGLQFTLLDVDYIFNDFADKITVYGTDGANTVYPTLTNGATNYVIGNTAIGDSGTDGQNADGNVTVTFPQKVDTIVIIYGNHTTAPTVPDGQAMAIHDITFCKPIGDLGITKLSSLISDPINGTTNPLAIPQAVIEYCLLISNDTGGTATSIVIKDEIPEQLLYTPNSMTSGDDCTTATTPEDDNATGTDETNLIGASVTGATITAIKASLAPDATMAIKFRASIK